MFAPVIDFPMTAYLDTLDLARHPCADRGIASGVVDLANIHVFVVRSRMPSDVACPGKQTMSSSNGNIMGHNRK